MNRVAMGRGFTLLELVIALAVFGIAALALLKNTDLMIRQQLQLEEKTLALWLAENRLAEIRLSQPWPPTGVSVKEVASGQREWQVKAEVSNTALPTLRRVDIEVTLGAADGRGGVGIGVISLVGYLGEH